MAIPHKIQMQIIKKRLKDKKGKARLKEMEAIREELPGFNTGHYGKIKQWLRKETENTKTRSKVENKDWLAVKKEGVKQFVLVGCPSVGKSSLIKALSGLQTKVADYEFTTLKPIPGIVNIKGANFQIVDLPGLIEGANEDAGGGKRLLGIVKCSDGILLMHDLQKDIAEVKKIVKELGETITEKPVIIIGNKIDADCAGGRLYDLRKEFPNQEVIGVSALTKEGFSELKDAIFKVSSIIRVFPKHDGKLDEPVILKKGSTVKEFAIKIHKDLASKLKFAKVSGQSVKFPNQQVGLRHQLKDGDEIELVMQK